MRRTSPVSAGYDELRGQVTGTTSIGLDLWPVVTTPGGSVRLSERSFVPPR
jgi:hypothetical protein